jgi:hypothetical protein
MDRDSADFCSADLTDAGATWSNVPVSKVPGYYPPPNRPTSTLLRGPGSGPVAPVGLRPVPAVVPDGRR